MAPRTIVVSGASGLVGSALVPALEREGHRVLRLVRHEAGSQSEIRWNPSARLFDPRLISSVDVVVNLAGEPIAKRWTSSRRRRIRSSRVDGTEVLVSAIEKAGRSSVTLINASAVGFYGDRGDDVLDEKQAPGRGFLAEICRQWENAANAAAKKRGTRVVTMRTGVVLAVNGGALKMMLPPFRFGLGGRLGSGRQWMSWIAIEDLVRAIVWIIEHPEISGPVNMTSPNPVTNSEFTAALGDAIHRPTILPIPGVALLLLFGEMAEETLLASQRAVPKVLSDSGFVFDAPDIRTALGKLHL
jgi:uncharacterized protein